MSNTNDLSLKATKIVTSPGSEYADDKRLWQGIPGVERASNGRLWATWYSGGKTEEPGNYVILVTSGDDGISWSAPKFIVDPKVPLRAYDPCLWHDPLGRLWLFWAQSQSWFDGRAGVWGIMTEDSGSETPTWSEPVRISNGVMMNKPTVLSTGEWLFPTAVWEGQTGEFHDLDNERGANVTCSVDNGKTWKLLGQANFKDLAFEEHMIVERKDGSLWMLVRAHYGIAESISKDRGKTWSEGKPTSIPHVDSRFFIRRLSSGRLLLISHNPPDSITRSHLIAHLSDDDGMSWYGGLMIDERVEVSYPDGIQSQDGSIYIIYDFEREASRQILLAKFTEEDVAQGKIVSKNSRMRMLVNQATGRLEE